MSHLTLFIIKARHTKILHQILEIKTVMKHATVRKEITRNRDGESHVLVVTQRSNLEKLSLKTCAEKGKDGERKEIHQRERRTRF